MEDNRKGGTEPMTIISICATLGTIGVILSVAGMVCKVLSKYPEMRDACKKLIRKD